MKVWNNIALPNVPMPLTTSAATQPTPLLIYALVNNSNPTEFDHTVDEAGMCAGGVTQNATRGCGPDGTCGDIDMVGVTTLRHDIADYPTADVDLLLVNKPQFKRFEMHGSLPAALQYGTVVSASKLHKQSEGGIYDRTCEQNSNPEERRTGARHQQIPEGIRTKDI